MSKKPKASLRRPSAAMEAFVEGRPRASPKQTSDVRRLTSDAKETQSLPVRWKRTVETKADGSRQKRLTVRLPEELAARLLEHAEKEGRSMSEVIAELVSERLTSDV